MANLSNPNIMTSQFDRDKQPMNTGSGEIISETSKQSRLLLGVKTGLQELMKRGPDDYNDFLRTRVGDTAVRANITEAGEAFELTKNIENNIAGMENKAEWLKKNMLISMAIIALGGAAMVAAGGPYFALAFVGLTTYGYLKTIADVYIKERPESQKLLAQAQVKENAALKEGRKEMGVELEEFVSAAGSAFNSYPNMNKSYIGLREDITAAANVEIQLGENGSQGETLRNMFTRVANNRNLNVIEHIEGHSQEIEKEALHIFDSVNNSVVIDTRLHGKLNPDLAKAKLKCAKLLLHLLKVEEFPVQISGGESVMTLKEVVNLRIAGKLNDSEWNQFNVQVNDRLKNNQAVIGIFSSYSQRDRYTDIYIPAYGEGEDAKGFAIASNKRVISVLGITNDTQMLQLLQYVQQQASVRQQESESVNNSVTSVNKSTPVFNRSFRMSAA